MSKRFRIAFSFSRDKRAFVAAMADILAGHFGQDHILYDKYHEAEFARPDLAFYLSDLYHEEADLIVVVLCNDYEKKEWCGLEWTAIYGLIKKRKHDEVMLCRFDWVEGQGLFGLAGFIDLDNKAPAEVATLITGASGAQRRLSQGLLQPRRSSRPGLARCCSSTRLASRRPQRGAGRLCAAYHPCCVVPSPPHPRY